MWENLKRYHLLIYDKVTLTDVIIAFSLVDHKYYFPRFVLITDLLNQFELE